VAIDGNTVAIAAWEHNHSAGAVYVFVRNETSGEWDQQAELSLSGSSEFGAEISLYGNTLAIAEPHKGNGYVHIYKRTGDTWAISQHLTPTDLVHTTDAYFGGSVQVRGDALIVGAPGESEVEFREGSAYVYTRIGDGNFENAVRLQ